MSEVTPIVPAEPEKPKFPLLSDRAYNFLKWLALIALPALSTLFITFAALWGMPADLVTKVVGTVTGLATFIGVLIGISNSSFNQLTPKTAGTLVLAKGDNDETVMYTALNVHPDHFADKDKVAFDVKSQL